VFDNPAVVWIWIGGALLVLGGVLYAIPRRRRITGDLTEEVTMSADDELSQLLDAAIVAARTGQVSASAEDPVNDLVSRAQELASAKSGGAATQDDVVAFLQEAKQRVDGEPSGTTPAPRPSSGSGGGAPTGGGSGSAAAPRKTGLWVVLGVVALVLIAGGAYLAGHASSGSVPSIDTTAPLTNDGAATPAASAAPAVDQAQVAALMQKISADPKDVKSLRDLGNIYYSSNDFKNAQIFYEKVVAVTPKDDDAWVAVGAAAFNQGDNAKAKSAWEQAIAVNPKNPEAHYDLGFAYLAQKTPDNEKAKAEWQTVIDLDPNSDWAKDAKSMLSQHLSGSAAPSASATPSSSASP